MARPKSEDKKQALLEAATSAMQTAKTAQVDLMIMDVGLPDMDGREAVKIMKPMQPAVAA